MRNVFYSEGTNAEPIVEINFMYSYKIFNFGGMRVYMTYKWEMRQVVHFNAQTDCL